MSSLKIVNSYLTNTYQRIKINKLQPLETYKRQRPDLFFVIDDVGVASYSNDNTP